MIEQEAATRQQEYDIALVLASGLFHESWYLANYPDVALQPLSAIRHFMWLGWRLGRSPGPAFDLPAYCQRHGAQLTAGVNPLLHYLTQGKSQGKRAIPLPGGYLDVVALKIVASSAGEPAANHFQ